MGYPDYLGPDLRMLCTSALVSDLDLEMDPVNPCCRTLHPDGTVNSLVEAMDPSHDAFYALRDNFVILNCQPYYDPVNEMADPLIVASVTALIQKQ
jgi:hypothetical protein